MYATSRNTRNFSFDSIPFDCRYVMLAEGQVRPVRSSCLSIHWKHSRFLSETFLHDTRNNRDNRVSPLTTDHPQCASNVTRAKSSGSLSLSLSLSLSIYIYISCSFSLLCISWRFHLDYSPGVHGTRYAYPHVCSNNWPSCTLCASPLRAKLL